MNITPHIISVNWAKNCIKVPLERRNITDFIVSSCDLLFDKEDVSTGDFTKDMLSGIDKVREMNKVLDSNKPGLSVYIGDGSTDVLPALETDIGIIIFKSENPSIISFCSDFHIELKPLYSCDRNNIKKDKSQPVLYFVHSWSEIGWFVFGSKYSQYIQSYEWIYNIPRMLIIAGSDSGGGAGIEADIKTSSALGVFSTCCLAALTSQNTEGVKAILTVPKETVESQLECILSDIGTNSVKTGMLGDIPSIKAIVDPVMVSTSGDVLLQKECVDTIKECLVKKALIITPNIYEAGILLNRTLNNNLEDLKKAAMELHNLGPNYVLVKGGHSKNATDVLYDGNSIRLYTHKFVNTNHTHGTGCTLGSAIASEIAKGFGVPQAVENAKNYISSLIEESQYLRIGFGKQNPMLHNMNNCNWLYRVIPRRPIDLSLYAVMDPDMDKKWNRKASESAEAAILGGATVIQMRAKELSAKEFIENALEVQKVCKKYNIPFLINDRVDIAMAINADGIHIGQSDMPLSYARKLVGTSMIIGVTAGTKATAIEADMNGADYIGTNAIFPTETKKDGVVMGIDTLNEICNSITIPIVAIGGIKKTNALDVMKSGVDGIAVVSALFDQPDVKVATEELKKIVKEFKIQKESN